MNLNDDNVIQVWKEEIHRCDEIKKALLIDLESAESIEDLKLVIEILIREIFG